MYSYQGVQLSERQANWATTDWVTRFGQLSNRNQVKWQWMCESLGSNTFTRSLPAAHIIEVLNDVTVKLPD